MPTQSRAWLDAQPRPCAAPRRAITEQQRQARALTDRLRTAERRIEKLLAAVQTSYEGGGTPWDFHRVLTLPAAPVEWRAAQSALERVREEAEAGCDRSARFLERWRVPLALVDHIRHEPPPNHRPGTRGAELPTQAERDARDREIAELRRAMEKGRSAPPP